MIDGPRIFSKSGLPEMWAQGSENVRLPSDFGRISQQILGLQIDYECGLKQNYLLEIEHSKIYFPYSAIAQDHPFNYYTRVETNIFVFAKIYFRFSRKFHYEN